MRSAAGRDVLAGRRLGPLELLSLGVLASVLLPGLALTAISPTAWPIPTVAAVGVLVVLGRAWLCPARPANRLDAVAAEAASGVTEIEAWLSQRHRA